MDTKIEISESENSYELFKIILNFIGSVSWPIVALTVVVLFKEEIRKIFINARKVQLPGGLSFEIDKEIQEIKGLANDVKNQRKPETQELLDKYGKSLEPDANKKMIELGLKPSPSGLNLSYYKMMFENDPKLALIGMRTDLEIMLRNLATGFKITISEKDSVSKVISKLYNKGAITFTQFELINKVFSISNIVVNGGDVSKSQVYEIIDIGKVLIDDYIAWLSWGFKQ